MRIIDSRLVFSPTDLSTYFHSPYVSWLRRYNLGAAKDVRIEAAEDPTDALLAKMGDDFEQKTLRTMREQGRVIEIPKEGISFEESLRLTAEALRSGADVVYQAALRKDDFQGYADFLVKVPGKRSALGDFSYEVADTKLARSPKPEYALQVCCYSEMLADLLGHWPDRWHLILGGGAQASYPMSDYRYYYAHFKETFLKFHREFSPDARPFPEPWEKTRGYDDHIAELFRAADHLRRTAGISLTQVKRLHERGLRTRTALAQARDEERPARIQKATFDRLRLQAQLQMRTEAEGTVAFEILDHAEFSEPRGLARLPEADPGDVIFDMEGYPFEKDGFEYLFGVLIRKGSGWEFKAWSAEEPAQERAAFEGFMDWLMSRYREFPNMHVYHYAAYEVTAVSHLSNKYSSKIAEVDQLLRNKVFVDLYRTVHEGARIGTPSYSIKDLEPLYGFMRQGGVATAGDSVIQFNQFLELKLADPARAQKIFAAIVEYNREDVESTAALLDWLRDQKDKHDIDHIPHSAEQAETEPPPTWEVLCKRIAEYPPAWVKADQENLKLNQLVADLTGYFQREVRPAWWAYFNRHGMQPEDRYQDAECLAEVVVAKELKEGYLISFDPEQPLKVKPGQKMNVAGHENQTSLTIEHLNPIEGEAVLCGADLNVGAEFCLVPEGPIPTKAQQTCLEDLAEAWLTKKPEEVLTSAALDLLRRSPPRVVGIKPGAELYDPSEPSIATALRLARSLQNSCLSIQGPPGTGKTYTGGYVIANLLKDGKRVAVVAQGKKSIENLLAQAAQWWKELFPTERLPATLMAGEGSGDEDAPAEFKYLPNPKARKSHTLYKLVGGTHWLFASKDLQRGQFDYLFVDEAGQFSLAATICCSAAAKNIVLLGDQMQLEQVNTGSHPGDSGLSVLNYYMNGRNTIPRTHGLFLAETFRMNPAIAATLSELIYENRLAAHARTRDHVLEIPANHLSLKASGIHFLAVDHAHNSTRSDEEVLAIEEVIRLLQKSEVPSADGGRRKFSGDANDLIVIAPYNAQVEAVRAKVKGVKAGSVDLFQGQEAWVSILSLCASGEEGVNRGLEFLLSKNRMNVGLSRGKALSILVGSPRLLLIRPKRLLEIPLLNFLAAIKYSC